MSEAKFIDEVKIYVEGGRGGNGCVSFRREKYVPRGGPDGGDGGKGGSVILIGDVSKRTLLDYHFKRHYKAEKGAHGQGKLKSGKDGKDLVLPVPLGTVIKDENGRIIGEILKHGQKVIVARGGKGGRGNAKFATSIRQAPSFCEKGEPGESRWIKLELRILADVGLVGFPNAGKSTLISRVSKARPKIADYPFTTLIPHPGTVFLPDGRTFVICDLPGIIEGASLGKGLGTRFLRHISRAAIILYVLDLASPEIEPEEAFKVLQNELKSYDASLLKRAFLVAGNKIDIPEAREKVERVSKYFSSLDIRFFPISAATGEGVEKLLYALADEVSKTPREIVAGEPEIIIPEIPEDIKIKKIADGVFEVTGRAVEMAALTTDIENEEAVLHLQKKFARFDLEEKLLKAGAKRGDTVIIAGIEFDFEPDNA